MDGFLSKVDDELHRRRMSRSELAREARIPVRTITNWYQRETSPKLRDARRIAEVLHISIDALFHEDGESDVLFRECRAKLLLCNERQLKRASRFIDYLLDEDEGDDQQRRPRSGERVP